MTDKTIKELAEEFHVSKQAIRKRLSADYRENYGERPLPAHLPDTRQRSPATLARSSA